MNVSPPSSRYHEDHTISQFRNSTAPYVFMAWCLISTRDNFYRSENIKFFTLLCPFLLPDRSQANRPWVDETNSNNYAASSIKVVFTKLERMYKSVLHERNSREARKQQIPVENKLDATLCAWDSSSFYLFRFQSIEAFLVAHGNDRIEVTKTNSNRMDERVNDRPTTNSLCQNILFAATNTILICFNA